MVQERSYHCKTYLSGFHFNCHHALTASSFR